MSIFNLKSVFETVFPKNRYVADDCSADGTPYAEMVYAVADQTSYHPHWIAHHLQKLWEVTGDLPDLTVAEAVQYVRSLPDEPFTELPQVQQQESVFMAGAACNFA